MDLFKILDGIVSDKEYCVENLASVDAVINYAESCGASITTDQAEKIIEVGTKWLDEQEIGNGEWSDMRQTALNALARKDVVLVNGDWVDFDAAVNLMDDDIREGLHNKLAPCNNQTFVDAYADAHTERFNETFVVN